MRLTQQIMGMPIEIEAPGDSSLAINRAFVLLTEIDELFSAYKPESQVSMIRRGELTIRDASADVQQVASACTMWKAQTGGIFDAYYDGQFDPSGYVKGWAIDKAARSLAGSGLKQFFINAGGDIVAKGRDWKVGIRLPSNPVKMACHLRINDLAIATSGNYERGQHIVNPLNGNVANSFGSISVIGPDIIIADVLATTFFAMGQARQAEFTELLPAGYELYIITTDEHALYTPGVSELRTS